jgi:DNA-binding transcriptional regulator YiaG
MYRNLAFSEYEIKEERRCTEMLARNEERLASGDGHMGLARDNIRYWNERLAQLASNHERSSSTECTLVRALRAHLGLTVFAMAARTHFWTKDLYAYERGKTVPRPTTLERLFSALEITVDELMTALQN